MQALQWRSMETRKRLSLRARREIIEAQGARCALCKCALVPGAFEFDHIAALIHSGTNDADNFRALCRDCHKHKTRRDVAARDRADRLAFGKPRKSQPMAGSRASPFKRKMSGEVVKR